MKASSGRPTALIPHLGNPGADLRLRWADSRYRDPSAAVVAEIYEEYGRSLPVSEWAAVIGGSGAEWDPCVYLETQAQCSLDHDDLRARRWQRKLALTALQPVLPGLTAYFSGAKRLGLRLGIASSSRIAFVGEQLDRLELRDLFDEIVCHLAAHLLLRPTSSDEETCAPARRWCE